jgi:serine/threonine-protein kinase RsbW
MNPPPAAPVLRFELACELSRVRAAAEAVQKFLVEQAVGKRAAADCELALVEACNNAIQNARGESRQRPVRIETWRRASEIELRVTDHTPGFELIGQAQLPPIESESGRGLFIIQKLMDQVEYQPGPHGNVLILRKILASKPVEN